MSYYVLLGSFFISVAFCNDVQSSHSGQQPTNNSNIMTLEDRLRVLEEALSANVVPESDSIEDRLAQMERALLASNSRVSQLISKLRRTNYAFAKDLVSEDKHEKMETQWGGVSYIRWGRTLCNDTDENATTVYSGYMAGAQYNVDGGGANFLCLHENPQWGFRKDGVQKSAGRIYGTENENYDHADHINPFSTTNSGGRSVYDKPLPCAACFVPQKSTWMMIPARRECPDGWTLQYKGYVHSQASGVGHQKNDYVCIDEAPEVARGATSQNQALIYTVQVGCGSLPCSIFTDGWELACVVCTR